ncbi:MAG: IPT/TIG domain-containing protein [Treponema sp.]|jgi:transglutaminase-like putative cysteine protease|nr:IPT/TIG domain-containing protein [Treponema sp.]
MIKKIVTTVVLSVLFLSCYSKVPVISSIDPKIGNMGDIITIRGRNFGAEREGAYVSIAGVMPTNSSYYTWQDDLILLRIPESGQSGLVYVHVKGRKSNGVLFSNYTAVPRPVEGEDFGMEPKIVSVNPQAGAPGTLVTITGNNFGASREDSGVFFSWDYEALSINPYVVTEPEFIEVSETEIGYEAWNAHEIRVRLPDGAVSGNFKIKTHNGESRPAFFDVTGKPGYKNFKDKRSYTISYSVDVKITEASRPNTLYLWIPMPVTSAVQRNVKLVSRSTNPFVENYRGVSLYKLDNISAGSTHTINLSFNVEVFAVETGIKPALIKQGKSTLNTVYTQSTNLIPADNSHIKKTVENIIGKEQNPYIKARLLYDWLIKNIDFIETPLNTAGAVSALGQKKADSCSAILLYTAMARAVKVPCIPTAGVLINSHSQTMRHYWAEIWIDDFGWLAVDPVLGAGAVPDSYVNKEETDLVNYYFGNIDSQRIAFSRGELNLSQMGSKGRLVSNTQSYSLQNIWEEASGGLVSYSSLWGDIIIRGTYAQ